MTIAAQTSLSSSKLDAARVLRVFIVNFMLNLELSIFGGEYGKYYFLDSLTAEQTTALSATLRSFSNLWAGLPWEELKRDNAVAYLTRDAQCIVDNAEFPDSTREVFEQVVNSLAHLRCPSAPVVAMQTPPTKIGTQRCGELALDVLLTFGSVYCAKLSTLVNEERAPDGSLGLQGYDNVTVWVDSGMGVIHALGEHYVEARTSTVQFLLDVLGELRRTTWEEASGHAEQRFRAMLDMVLEQIA